MSSSWHSYKIFPDIPHTEMVLVEGGSFMMGSEDGIDSWPIHKVDINSFYLGQYLVSQTLWKKIIAGNYSYFKGKSLPMEILWPPDIIKFCNCLSDMLDLEPVYEQEFDYTGLKSGRYTLSEYNRSVKWRLSANLNANGYRLPTEEEWEYGARGGKYKKGAEYAGSSILEEVGWYSDEFGDKNSHEETQILGFRLPNELGLYDMSGNIWEWCWGDYRGGELKEISLKYLDDPKRIYFLMSRGGAWNTNSFDCSVYNNFKKRNELNFSFRLARTP